jgi:hypothetical protein
VKRANNVNAPRAVHGLRGTVIEAAFARRSKSERNAPFLQTAGQRYLLRRRGGPSYGDATLTRFVGHAVECDGTVTSYLLLVDRIEQLD